MAGFDLSSFDFSSMMAPEMPVLPEQNWLGKTKDALGNPLLQILMDKMGQSLDPNAPFAGVGEFAGQSKLANVARQEAKPEQRDWRNLIAQMISGKAPVTAAGIPGISGASVKPGKEPGTSELSFSVTEPTDKKKNTRSIDLGGEIASSPF